jgi:hypothetical protein
VSRRLQVGSDSSNAARLLAFAPPVELYHSNRSMVFPLVLQSLVVAAIISNRTPVMPLVPCDSPWAEHWSPEAMHAAGASSTLHHRFLVQFGPPDDIKCMWKAWCCAKCEKVTMPWYDFMELLKNAPEHVRESHDGVLLRISLSYTRSNQACEDPRHAYAGRGSSCLISCLTAPRRELRERAFVK